MLSAEEKEKIEKKLNLLCLENGNTVDYGKTKRVVHTLYQDSEEKKKYLVYLIALANPVLAAQCVHDLPNAAAFDFEIEAAMEQRAKTSAKNRLQRVVVYFYLKNTEKMAECFIKYEKKQRSAWKYNVITPTVQAIEDVLPNIKEYLVFFLACIHSGCFPEKVLSFILFKRLDETRFNENEIRSILHALEEKEYYYLYIRLVSHLGFHKAIHTYHINMDSYIQLLEQQTVGERMTIELKICEYLIPSVPDIYRRFREKYKVFWPQGAKHYLLSIFQEYLFGQSSFDEFCQELASLDAHCFATKMKTEYLFHAIFRGMEKIIYDKQDVVRYLKLVQKYNISKAEETRFLPITDYTISVKDTDDAQKLTVFLIENYSSDIVIYTYFNSCIKCFMEIKQFFLLLIKHHPLSEINDILKHYFLPGKFKYYDKKQGIMVGLWNIKSDFLFYYKTDHIPGLRKGDNIRVSLKLLGEGIYVENVILQENEKVPSTEEEQNKIAKMPQDPIPPDTIQLADPQVEEMLRRFRILAKRDDCGNQTYMSIKNVPIELYTNREEIILDIHKSLKKAIFIRRHDTTKISKMLKSLSLHNPYCARNFHFFNCQLLQEFREVPAEFQPALELLRIIIRNAIRINDCFFIYINSYLKQQVSVSKFFELCAERDFINETDFEISFFVWGKVIEGAEPSDKVFVPLNMQFEQPFPIPKEISDITCNKAYAWIEVRYSDGVPNFQLMRCTPV